MAEHTARVLRSDEHKAAEALFCESVHSPPPTGEQAQHSQASFQPGRAFGVFDDDELLGTARSMDSGLVVPGGAEVANAAVTEVGVRSDRTRRGVLRELMRAQLADCAERGVVTANLHASEGGIYGRFGYGPATYARDAVLDRRRAVLRDDLPAGGEVERMGLDAALVRLPEIYSALPADRPGMLGRSAELWQVVRAYASGSQSLVVPVVHHGMAGVDGFALYEVRRRDERSQLFVQDLHAATPQAFVGLWRYLLGVDLVDEIVARNRPLDEPTALLFTDPRAYRTEHARDETWLRLVDVPGALRAMRREADPLVIEVDDRMLERNSGRYVVTPDAVHGTDEPADLSLDAGTLAMIYLGTWRPSDLADFGRVTVRDPDVTVTADRLFGARRAAWCGTFF